MLPAGHVIFALLSASGTAQREGLGGGFCPPPPFLENKNKATERIIKNENTLIRKQICSKSETMPEFTRVSKTI